MRAGKGQLSAAEEEALVDELLDALDASIESSGCPDMAPLWFIATTRPRREFLRSEGVVQGVPEHLKHWRPPKRSKYAALVAWRHVVLWRGLLDWLETKYRKAVRDIYFSPFEDNVPPYSWSKASSKAPNASLYSSPSTLDLRASSGCRLLFEELQRLAEPAMGASLDEEARAAFAAPAARRTLRDVLRIEGA